MLDPTYGIIVYQEQVMQVFRTLGGYSLGRADIVRRAMAKKKHEVMKKEKEFFLYGEKDIFSIPEKSQKLFDSCSAADKKIVWFDKGGHSHLRINNTEKYDNAIMEFFKD